MIISRTPFRISFFGGSTDYPTWYREHGGDVLATTIDKYCWITCRWRPPFFPDRHRVVYSQTETVQEIDEIRHPSVRETMRFMGITDGIEIHHDGDLPARTGIGSSSAFTVGLLYALYALKGIMPTKMQLALEAIHIEQDLIKEHVGSQDQTLAAFGGFNRINFSINASGEHRISLNPITVNIERLESHLMLFFTGFTHMASQLAGEIIREIPKREVELDRMHQMVDEAVNILGGKDLTDFGKLLDESWKLKRSLATRISTEYIDFLYDKSLEAGAIGGKLLGAGSGGFLLLFVLPEIQNKVREKLRLLEIPFKFEREGSKIIFYEGG